MNSNRQRQGDADFAGKIIALRIDLFRIARAILPDDHLAEDAVGQAYLRAWQQRRTLRSPAKLGAWLRQICRNEARRLLEGLKRHPRYLADVAVLQGHDAGPARQWERELRRDLLTRLPESLKVCAEMHFFDGMSYSEIASVTALPLSTVRGRIYQSRKHLRKEIEMTSQTQAPSCPTGEETIEARAGRTEWRGARIRYLGSFWGGQTALYDATGKRLSRRPAVISVEALRRASEKTFSTDRDGPTLCLAWEMSGNPEVMMGSNAFGVPSGRDCQPCCALKVLRGRKKCVFFVGGAPAEGDRYVRVASRLWGGANGETVKPFRFVPKGHDLSSWGIATAPAGFGAVFVCPARRTRRKGTCELTVALSSREFEKGCVIFGIDSEGNEVRGELSDGAGAACAEGHLRVVTVRLAMRPREVKGVTIFARHRASVEWGRVRLPRRPSSRN